MRFTLVDRIVSLEKGDSITAIKSLSLAEEYLADHFPGFPVMPGVLMLESMIQSSAWLMRYSEDFEYSAVLLKQARAVKFNSFLKPGKTLTVTSKIQKWDGDQCTVKAAGTVDGESTVSARLTLERFNLKDRNPKLAENDEFRTEKMKELFAELWKESAE
ncbi:MAG: beta-hydroxyacyl-ACP dehydratase [Planctomycetaceae bacterium]|nr:beta-hydroxyacyl-ACP dehydratase [Planctomycetaceae bacterium]